MVNSYSLCDFSFFVTRNDCCWKTANQIVNKAKNKNLAGLMGILSLRAQSLKSITGLMTDSYPTIQSCHTVPILLYVAQKSCCINVSLSWLSYSTKKIKSDHSKLSLIHFSFPTWWLWRDNSRWLLACFFTLSKSVNQNVKVRCTWILAEKPPPWTPMWTVHKWEPSTPHMLWTWHKQE